MLTQGATAVNTTAPPPPAAVMFTIAQIAKRDGVSKPNVSRKVKQLVEQGLQVTRDGQGRVSGVNIAEYDELRGRYADPSKAQAPAPVEAAAPAASQKETYEEALRVKTWIEAERGRMRLAQERGELVSAAEVAEALEQCGIEIGRVVDRLLSHADELAAAAAKDGLHGLRVALKGIAFKLKADVADHLKHLATSGTSEVVNERAGSEPAGAPERAAPGGDEPGAGSPSAGAALVLEMAAEEHPAD